MNRRIRVLHILWDFDQGGMERMVHELVRRLPVEEFESHVLSLGGLGHFAEGLEGHATLHLMPPMSRWSMLAPRELAAAIRRIEPDVVHTHSGVWYKSTRAARSAGVDAHIHTDHGREGKESVLDHLLEVWAARYTNIVVGVSPWLVDHAKDRLNVGDGRAQLIQNGVDTAKFSPGRTGERPAFIPEGRAAIGSVGRFVPIKDYATMIKALAIVLARVGEEGTPSLILIGDGSERLHLRELAIEHNLAHLVSFPGWISDVESVLPWFDIFSLSSLSEGTSMSLIEAMSCEVCPIVTAVGGNELVLGPSLRKRMVSASSPEQLATAWMGALENRRVLTADAKEARRRVIDQFGLERMTEEYSRLYQSLVPTPRPVRSAKPFKGKNS